MFFQNDNMFDIVNGVAFLLGLFAAVVALGYAHQFRGSGKRQSGQLPWTMGLFLGQLIVSYCLLFLLVFEDRSLILLTMEEMFAFMGLSHAMGFFTMWLMNRPSGSSLVRLGGITAVLSTVISGLILSFLALPSEAVQLNIAAALAGSLLLSGSGYLGWRIMRRSKKAPVYVLGVILLALSMLFGQLMIHFSLSSDVPGMIHMDHAGMDSVRLQFILLFNMATAMSLAFVIGDNPRHHWRRYAVAGGLVSAFALLVYQATDRAMTETARYFELARLVETVKNQRYELREIVEDFQSSDHQHMSSLILPAKTFDTIEAFNRTIIEIDQLMSSGKTAPEIRNAYFEKSDQSGETNLQEDLELFGIAVTSALGLQVGSGVQAKIDDHQLELALASLSAAIMQKAYQTNSLQFLVRDMSLGSGIFIIIFLSVGVFLPAHTSTVNALNELEAEKDRVYKLALCAEHTTKGVVVSNREGKMVWCNEAFSEITGYSFSELQGNGIIRMLRHPDADMREISRMLSELNEWRSSDIEIIARRRDGTDVWLKIAVSPVEQDGEVLQFVHVVEDITEQRAIGERLKQASRENERLALIAKHASDGQVILDREYKLIWVNAAMQKMSGYSFEEMKQIDLKYFLHGPLTDVKVHEDILTKIRKREPVTAELLVYTKTGEPFWIETINNPLFEKDGKFAGYVIVQRDITERKNLQMELISHRDELAARVEERTQTIRNQALELEKALDRERELNRLQAEFVSMASHEFRTPLTIIDGVARRLSRRAEKLTSEEIQERSQKIRATVKRMTMLVERTLDATRLSSGRIKLTPEHFDLKGLLSEIVSRQCEVATTHDIQMNLDNLPDELYGDARLLDNVFTNVLSNAVKYSGDSRRVIVTGEQDGTYAIIRMKDFGIGIPEGEISKIFQRFFRASTSTGIPGTGIGLNLVKSLVEMHYGEVCLESEEGAWTEVTISLPLESPLEGQQHIPGSDHDVGAIGRDVA